MTFSSPQVLLGLVILLGVLAIGLTIWLLRYAMGGKRDERPKTKDSSEAQAIPAQARRPDEAKDATSKAPEASPAAPASVSPAVQASATPPATSAGVPPEAQASVASSARPPAAPAPDTTVRQPPSQPGDTLLMRIWRDREGFLVVEAGGQRYRRLFDIRDGELGRQVLEVIQRLDAFSRGKVSQIAPPPVPEAPAVDSEEIVQERSQALLEKFNQPETSAPKKTLLTADPVPFRRVNEAQMSSITLNLAAEIDSFLQIRVEASPEFSARHLRVANAPDGGLRFEVDGARYGAIDEIPERSVQRIIKAAIADWEAKR